MKIVGITVLSLMLSCGSNDANSNRPTPNVENPPEDTDPPEDTGGTGDSEIPGDTKDQLSAFLSAESYKSWENKHAAPVDSDTVHKNFIRNFFNDTVAAALKAGKTTMPDDSLVVKEMFETQTGDAVGKAIMKKSGGKWVWYETLGGGTEYYGESLALCEGCHGSGTDQLRSELP